MAVNKIVYNEQVLMDLTGDTVTREMLVYPATAHTASGEVVHGSIDDYRNDGQYTFCPVDPPHYDETGGCLEFKNDDVAAVIDNSTMLLLLASDLHPAIQQTVSARDIRFGKSVLGFVGTMQVQSVYTGSGEPSSSLGSEGDFYFDLG